MSVAVDRSVPLDLCGVSNLPLRKLRYKGLCDIPETTSVVPLRLATCPLGFSASTWQSDAALLHRKHMMVSLLADLSS